MSTRRRLIIGFDKESVIDFAAKCNIRFHTHTSPLASCAVLYTKDELLLGMVAWQLSSSTWKSIVDVLEWNSSNRGRPEYECDTNEKLFAFFVCALQCVQI